MSTTLPSKKIVIADAPEIGAFKAKFVYNYFEKDERQNDSGLISKEFVTKRPSEGFDAQFVNSKAFNRFTSRYIQFDWKPNLETESIKDANITIKDNIKKVHFEQDFLGEDYTSLVFQDSGKDGKMQYFFKRLLQQQKNQQDPNAAEITIQQSPMDAVKTMLEKTSDVIEPSLVCDSMINLESDGYVFLDKNNDKITTDSLLKEMANVKTFGHINSKFLWTIMKSALEGNLNVFEDEVLAAKDKYKQIEQNAQNVSNNSVVSSQDYDIEIQEYVGEPKKVETNGYSPKKQILGYIIDKTEKDINDNVTTCDPIIIENPNIATTIDLKVKYGSTYYYSIRAIYYVETQAEESDTGELYIIAHLLSSKSSITRVVPCIETVAPPPPADFDVRWDANKAQLALEWNFPINPQRDIKKWQIFRRSSIKEAFQLIKVYDFNDSTIVADDGQTEYPSPYLIEKLVNPQTFFIDHEFVKNKSTGEYPTFIYAVCSVDAHGHSSNYSIQVECTFNRFKNKLLKKMVSHSGAPKPFPNYYLLMDTFVDVMRTSRKNNSVKVVFSPEYLKVVDNENNDLRLIKTGLNESYKINLINLDIQDQQNIEINIKDMRLTEDKTKDNLTKDKKTVFRTKRRINR